MKKNIRIVIIVLLVPVAGFMVLHVVVKNKINTVLDKQVQKGNLTYADFSINLLAGSCSLDSLTYRFKKDSISADNLRIEDFSYWSYMTTDTIRIGKISVDHPIIKLHKKSKSDTTQKKGSKGKTQLKKAFKIEDIEIQNANLSMTNDTLIKLRLEQYSLHLDKIAFTEESLKQNIPFTYKKLELEGGRLYFHLNKLQDLTADHIHFKPRNAVIDRLKVIPNYTRKSYVEVIPYEKDLMSITINSLKLKEYQIDLNKPHGEFSVQKIVLDSIDADLFRDKTVNDDPRAKKLYSGMLRDLNLKLKIDSLQMLNTDLTYDEVQEKTGKTGEVFFKNINVLAKNITNMYLQTDDFQKTKVAIFCQFMGTSPLKVEWEFKINDPQDQFRIRGTGENIPPKALNSFFIPAFNMKAKGKGISRIDFDFYGNQNQAHGNYKMVYDDLRIEVLKDNKKKKGFFTFLANIIVKKDNKQKEGAIQVSEVKRDNTKSFWNYLWRCIFSGLKETVVF